MGYENSGRKRAGVKALLDVPAKPPLIVPAGTDTRSWIRNEADEKAYAGGCRFNEALAAHIVDFFPAFLCHSQGRWAGEPFVLDDWWIEEVIFPVFGWVYPDGLRRVRDAYVEIGKKNGKSAVDSGIGLYMLVGDEEMGSHCYSFGADSSQAAVVHGEAISMVKQSPKLDAVLDINETSGKIKYTATDSFFARSSSAKRGKSGIKAHFMSCDELHEWFGRALWDDIEYAGAMRTQPLRLAITNSGKDTESICYDVRAKALRWLTGEAEDEQFFGLVMNPDEPDVDAEIDEIANGGNDLTVARSVNPMLGSILSERDMLQQIRNAAETPGGRSNLKRYRYCVWASGCETPLLEPGSWDRCRGEYTAADLIGAPCAAALDAAEIRDPTALSLVFPHLDEQHRVHYRVLSWNWLARKNALSTKDANRALYSKWEHDPLARLTLTEGDATDFGVVRGDVVEIFEQYSPTIMLFDSRKAEKLTQEICDGVCDSTGAVVIPGSGIERHSFGQGIPNYAEPTHEFERCVLEQRIAHDGNPMLAWEMGHCSFEQDKDGNKKPVKPGSAHDNRKVDAVQTVIMGIAGCMQYVDIHSAYATPGAGVVTF